MCGARGIHPAQWNDQIYVMHDFMHPLYCRNVMPSGEKYTQLPAGDSGR